MKTKKRFGDILVEAGLVTNSQVQQALEFGKRKGLKLGKALEELGLVDEKGVARALSTQLGTPLMDLRRIVLDPGMAEMVSEMLARKHLVVPIGHKGGELLLAMVDPLNIFAVDEISKATRTKVIVCVATESHVKEAIERLYGGTGKQAAAVGIGTGDTEDTEAVNLINEIILEAVQKEASDIHIEQLQTHLRIRIRVDGVLQSLRQLPPEMHPSVISRIKVLSGMDIGERRKPQDGRFEMSVAGKDIDFRVSSLPASKGEKIVLRLLDKSSIRLALRDLGLEGDQHEVLSSNLRKPHGMILVTGPTGSGKTTTLYACLNTINSVEKNIVTVEDPVEYELEGVSQVQVNPRADMTFANALRSILRQDPDIIMVGEIRDVETADIAIQASLTGHLVLSTLHTNTACGAVARLIDMEIQPFLIASSLMLVAAQRLVRRLCPHCRRPFEPPPELQEELRLDRIGTGASFFRAVGCERCNGSGYRGRIAIFEMLVVDPDIDALIVAKASAGEIYRKARSGGMVSLREAGLRKAAGGITSLDEVIRVTVDARD